MFKYTNSEITAIAEENGFIKNTTEKVLRLCDILEFIGERELNHMLALKGGTAINLCLLNLPRLSVDIDLDFTLSCSREEMLEKRKGIKDLIERFMQDEGYGLSDRSRYAHTLDSYVFSYNTLSGSRDVLKIEINYSDRYHVLDPVETEINLVLKRDLRVRRLADAELIGSKINALLVRTTPRDVYDVYKLYTDKKISEEELVKKIAIFYVTLGVEKPVNFENIYDKAMGKIDGLSYNQLRETLIPVLHKGEKTDIPKMSQCVMQELKQLFKLTETEKEFITAFNDGAYRPQLLFDGLNVNDLSAHPMALWKVRK